MYPVQRTPNVVQGSFGVDWLGIGTSPTPAAEMVLDALEEHHAIKVTLAELGAMNGDERFDAKFAIFTANVRRHVKEEERVLSPAMRSVCSKSELASPPLP